MSIFTQKPLAQKLFNRSFFILPFVLSASLLSACNGSIGSNPDVSARQDIMKNWGDAMDVMGGMMKNPDTFDAAQFKEQAAFLAGDAKNPWAHFADKTATGHATEAVWSNAENFKNEAAKFEKVTADLNAVAQNATRAEEVQVQFKAVGGTCKSCHTDFKVKED
ncbi:MAG: cytochrome c [Psychrobacter sp.]|nr:cytochrome c [Psychrobacter sp.]